MRGVRPVRIDQLGRGDTVCTEDGAELYVVEQVWLVSDDRRTLVVRTPDGEQQEVSWDSDRFADEAFVAVSQFRSRAIMGDDDYWPTGDVRLMALEVVRYLVSLEGALDPALTPYVDRALRASAYACLRSMAGMKDEALV